MHPSDKLDTCSPITPSWGLHKNEIVAVLHVCPLPSNYRLTLGAPASLHFRTKDEAGMLSPETTTPVHPRYNSRLRTASTQLPISAHLHRIYNSNELNLHINDTILLRAMPTLPTSPQYTSSTSPCQLSTSAFSLQDRMMTAQSIFSTPRPLQNQQHASCHYTHYWASYISQHMIDRNYCAWQQMPICGIITA